MFVNLRFSQNDHKGHHHAAWWKFIDTSKKTAASTFMIEE
jgi:hypothetical protein